MLPVHNEVLCIVVYTYVMLWGIFSLSILLVNYTGFFLAQYSIKVMVSVIEKLNGKGEGLEMTRK